MKIRTVAFALLLFLVVAPAMAGQGLDVRVFVLAHKSPAEASRAIEKMLSADGSLTVQPAARRLTVQDHPEVIQRVDRFLQQFDVADPEFRVRLTLFRATNGKVKKTSADAVPDIDPGMIQKMQRMFRYRHFEPLGWTVVHGVPGTEVGVGLGERYRVVFNARVLPGFLFGGAPIRAVEKDHNGKKTDRRGQVETVPGPSKGRPADGTLSSLRNGGPDRLRLEHLRLLRQQEVGRDGPMDELLKTTLMLAPGQSIVLGAAPSEKAKNALVLVVEALDPTE